MARTYKKGESEIEDLKAEVKRLKRIIRQLQKSAHIYNNIRELVEEIPQNEDKIDKVICGNCGKGEIAVLDLGLRKVLTCTLCDFREVIYEKEKT